MQPSHDITRLLEIMSALRTPETGCPWDLEQDFVSIAPYTLEEAYEVVDAIERGNMHDLADELGDLLLQVVFHAQMAKESGVFSFDDVVMAITTKMIRRHPHVFGDVKITSSSDVKHLWDDIKQKENQEKTKSCLDNTPIALTSLTRAVKLQKKAGKVGFDWNNPQDVLKKMAEETQEIEQAMASGSREHQEEEIGDLLFAVSNLARHLHIDPEQALRRTNQKFINRFNYIETELAKEGRTPEQSTLDEMEQLWIKAKTALKVQNDSSNSAL